MFVNTIGSQFDVVDVVAHFLLLLVDSIIRRAKVGAGEVENYKGVVADSLLVQCPAAMIGQETEGGWWEGEIGCRISAALLPLPKPQEKNFTQKIVVSRNEC